MSASIDSGLHTLLLKWERQFMQNINTLRKINKNILLESFARRLFVSRVGMQNCRHNTFLIFGTYIYFNYKKTM